MQVLINKKFLTEHSNTVFFKDWKCLSENQKILIRDFTINYLYNKPLCGKNKPNHLNDNGATIPNTYMYKNNNLYHYHIGYKSYNTLPINFSCNHINCIGLQINMQGNTSAGVLHYIKFDDQTIGILSFGEKHQPFPQCNSKNNLLIQRLTIDTEFVDLSQLK